MNDTRILFGFHAVNRGLLAPKGTSAEVLGKLRSACGKGAKDSGFAGSMLARAKFPSTSTESWPSLPNCATCARRSHNAHRRHHELRIPDQNPHC